MLFVIRIPTLPTRPMLTMHASSLRLRVLGVDGVAAVSGDAVAAEPGHGG